MLDIRNLSKTYAGPDKVVRALADVTIEVPVGEFVAVQGPSGSGKSTLLLAAGGLQGPESGSVAIDGQNVYALSPADRARFRAVHIGFVFQQFHLVPYLSVLDNVLTPSLATGVPDAHQRAGALIEEFGLTARIAHVPAELSVGERQRTALARALLNRPKVLLADEPTGNLDTDNANVVLEHLAAFARNGGAVLLVTHDARAAEYAQRAVHLKNGTIVDNG